jgi:hypothetical protein
MMTILCLLLLPLSERDNEVMGPVWMRWWARGGLFYWEWGRSIDYFCWCWQYLVWSSFLTIDDGNNMKRIMILSRLLTRMIWQQSIALEQQPGWWQWQSSSLEQHGDDKSICKFLFFDSSLWSMKVQLTIGISMKQYQTNRRLLSSRNVLWLVMRPSISALKPLTV